MKLFAYWSRVSRWQFRRIGNDGQWIGWLGHLGIGWSRHRG
jgi:hypothetical protein